MRTRLVRLLLVPVSAALLASPASAAVGRNYDSVTEITDLHGYATAVNERGQVVGYGTPPGQPGEVLRPFLWEGGSWEFLGSEAESPSYATAINSSGVVTGFATLSGEGRAVIWEEDGTTVDLNVLPLGSGGESAATGINARGQVVGWYRATSWSPVATFLWEDGAVTSVTVDGVSEPSGEDINNRGQIVGSGWTPDGSVSFTWRRGQAEIIAPLGTEGVFFADINDSGLLAGHVDSRPATMSPRGDLRLYPGLESDFGVVRGLNNRGDLVGYSNSDQNVSRIATVWVDGEPVGLPGALDGVLSDATAVNNKGHVVGMIDWQPVIWMPATGR